MPISCEFHLERVNTVYYTGEEIKGSIILRTQKIIIVNAVFITLAGEAIVQWTRGEDGATKSYYDQQKLLHHSIKVFDGTYYPAGKHVYKISMLIPHSSPSTCEGRYGRISYDISVRIDRHWIYDKVFRKPIIVYQTLDLNEYPEYMLPVKDENIKYLCRWPCRSGPILSSLVIPFSGYIPEESISFSISIDNQSQYDIAGVEASLQQHFIFLERNPINQKYFTKILAKTVINKSTLRLSKRMYGASIVVPPATQRTTLHGNYNVSLHYELQVKLKTGRLHYDIVMTIPIVIGTVPLERMHNDHAMVRMPSTASIGQSRSWCGSFAVSNDNVNATNIADNVDLPSYASLAPPSFAVATSRSLQTVVNCQHDTNERQCININLPQFPGYNTFACRTQAEINASYPDLDYVCEENPRVNLLRAEWRSLDDFAVNHAIHTDNEESEENILEGRNS